MSLPEPAGYYGAERIFGKADDPESVGMDVIDTSGARCRSRV